MNDDHPYQPPYGEIGMWFCSGKEQERRIAANDAYDKAYNAAKKARGRAQNEKEWREMTAMQFLTFGLMK